MPTEQGEHDVRCRGRSSMTTGRCLFGALIALVYRVKMFEDFESRSLLVRGFANSRWIKKGRMAQLAEGFQVIDADTHYTEPYDLWTSRAPKGYENRVLHMEEREGLATWVVDGTEIGFARGGGVVARTVRNSPSSMRWRGDSTGCTRVPSIRRPA